MKPLYIAAVLALGLSACVDNPPEVQLFQAIRPDEECVIDVDGEGILHGSLDLNYAASYLLGFTVNSNLNGTEVVIGTQPVGGTNTDPAAVYLDRVEVSYSTTPSLAIPSEKLPIYVALRGGSEGNTVVLDLMTRRAYELLGERTQTEDVEVLVTLKLTGKTAVGDSASSNEVTFPFTAFRSTTPIRTCGADEDFEPAGPCGTLGGQDGALPACIPDTTTP